MTGLLSQALENVQTAEKNIQSLSGLPDAAKKIQSDSAKLISPIVLQIQKLQSEVAAFQSKAAGLLDQAEQEIKAKTPVDKVKATLLTVKNEAEALQSAVAQTAQSISTSASKVEGYSNSLATIVSQLNAQKAALEGQLGTERSKDAAAKKKYYYLIALGPFGLVGRAAALALYEEIKKGVDKLEREASALSAQIAHQKQLVIATQQLGKDFGDLVSKVSSIENAVDFLAGDIANVINDLETSGKPEDTALVFVVTAKTELNTLASDAS